MFYCPHEWRYILIKSKNVRFFPRTLNLRCTVFICFICEVRVFEQTSRGESMILTLGDQGRPDIAEVARAIIGKQKVRKSEYFWISFTFLYFYDFLAYMV